VEIKQLSYAPNLQDESNTLGAGWNKMSSMMRILITVFGKKDKMEFDALWDKKNIIQKRD
jgi:hypothetical protein